RADRPPWGRAGNKGQIDRVPIVLIVRPLRDHFSSGVGLIKLLGVPLGYCPVAARRIERGIYSGNAVGIQRYILWLLRQSAEGREQRNRTCAKKTFQNHKNLLRIVKRT